MSQIDEEMTEHNYISMTSEIVSAYAAQNVVTVKKLTEFIKLVHSTLVRLNQPQEMEPKLLVPAVHIKKSITPDFLICLEDGKKLKTMKRHLKSSHDMTPDEYRDKWDLPKYYPMVSPNYAQHRRHLANKIGLGRKKSSKKK